MNSNDKTPASACPRCGAPIYVNASARAEYTCDCRNQQQEKTQSSNPGLFKTGCSKGAKCCGMRKMGVVLPESAE